MQVVGIPKCFISFETFPSKLIDSNLGQLEKQAFPNELTEEGMVMLVKLEQEEKQ